MVRFAPTRQIAVKFTGKEAEALMRAADHFQDHELTELGVRDPHLGRAMRKIGLGLMHNGSKVGRLRMEGE